MLHIEPLQSGLSFGVRACGLDMAATANPAIRDQLRALFEEHGLILFDGIEPSDALQVEISKIYGELKEHPVAGMARVDDLPGVIIISSPAGSGGVVSLRGKQLSHWLPWHFDHCYNDELNRAGVLRATEIVDEGGITGFADGAALYRAFPRELLAAIEGRKIIYRLDVQYEDMRFGLPGEFAVIRPKPTMPGFAETVAAMPRALHPAVWTREDGKKVLHVSPWMAQAIEGAEDETGDALLEDICQTVNALAKANSYHHKWRSDQMLIWDNWRMLHCVSGHDPALGRTMVRTTIKGDYGLGAFEQGRAGGKILSETTV